MHLDKAPDAFRTISEVADDLDVPQHVLRFWETRFSQIKPMKRSGGRRYYRPDDVNLLRGIRRLLYGEGYTIRGVQRILREHGIKSVQSLTDTVPGQAPAVFDGPAFPDSDALEDADIENDVEMDTEEAAAPSPHGLSSPFSLRDLGPPLGDPNMPLAVQPAPAPVRPPVQAAHVGGPSGAEAYAPPNVRRTSKADRGKLQAALDDLIGARALIDQALKDG